MKIVLILGLTLAFSSVQAQTTPLDFHQTLQRSLDRSPRYQTFVLTAKNAQLGEKNAWVSLLPAFDLQATHTYTQQSGNSYYSISPYHYPLSNQAGLSITENLYDNGETWRQAEIASLNREYENLNLESGRSRLLVDVAKAYFDYSIAAAAVELQKQQIESLRTQLRMIEGRYKQGLRSNRDYVQVKAQAQSAEISLVTQQISLDSAQSALRLAIGEDTAVQFLPVDVSRMDFSRGPDSHVDVEQTYDYRLTHVQEKISDIRFQSAQRTEWPRLSLRGTYNYVQPQYIGSRTDGIDDPFWNLQAMLVLDFHLWDWGKTWRTVEIADNQKNIERSQQRQTRLQALDSIQTTQKQLSLLQSSFVISGEVLRAKEEAYRVLNRGYVDGKVTYLELITALNDLYSSRNQDLNLRFSILKLRAELAYIQGNVDDTFKNL